MPEKPSNFSEFNAQAAGKALGAEPHTMRDVAHGDGEALTVGDAVLEVYRDAGVARVITPDARIELFRVTSYSVNGERVVFEQGTDDDRTRLLVRGDGKVSHYPVLRAAETSGKDENAVNGRQDSSTPQVPSETPTGRQTTQSPDGEKNGEVEQQVLQGRLGRDAWFSNNGEEARAGFPLAIHDEQGQTTWQKVVTFGETADEIEATRKAGKIRKGRLVQVQGLEVTREELSARGARRPVKEFHATQVTRMTSSTVPHPKGR